MFYDFNYSYSRAGNEAETTTNIEEINESNQNPTPKPKEKSVKKGRRIAMLGSDSERYMNLYSYFCHILELLHIF